MWFRRNELCRREARLIRETLPTQPPFPGQLGLADAATGNECWKLAEVESWSNLPVSGKRQAGTPRKMRAQRLHEARPPSKLKGLDANSSQRDQGLCKVVRLTIDFAQRGPDKSTALSNRISIDG